MKQVPYKCRFGHITIVSFERKSFTKGTVECEECKKLVGTEIILNRNRGQYVKLGERAVRI